MSQITQGNRLYLYQLLSRELGVGKQTKLEQVEQTLVADDILPQDLDCADTRELMGALDGIVRVTVFKRGRVYVTVLANPEYDAYLQAPEEEKAPQPRKRQGRKAWKQKRSPKIPRPAKPKPKNRVQEPEPDVPASDATAVTTTGPTTTEEALTESAQPTIPDTTEATEPETTAAPIASDVTPPDEVVQETSETSAQPEAADVQAAPQEPVTDTLAEALPRESVSVPTPAAETPHVQTTVTAPTAPAPATEPQDVPTAEVADQAVPATPEAPVAPAAPVAVTEEEVRPEATPAEAVKAEAIPTDEVKAEQAIVADAHEASAPAEEEPSPTAESPAASEEGALTTETAEAAETDEAVPAGEPLFHAGTHTNIRLISMPISKPESTPVRQRIFPDSFALEVRLENEPLSALYSILPFDVDPTALLDEDWRFSESIESYTYEDARLRFPLRYLRSDDKPVEVTLRRVAPGSTGKRWLLEDVNIGDETSLWGLPVADEGAWSHLSDAWRRPHTLVSPRRELARFAHLGKPRDLLESLASIAEAEWWGDDFEVLSDYLAITFWRARIQSKIAISLDGSHAALDTGLVSPEGAPILMHFEERTGKVPWTFDHFGTDDQGLTPEPPTYVSELSHITLKAGAGVRLSREVARSHGDAICARVEQAVRYAVRNHRVATPAFDPQTDEIRLLVPIRDEEGEVFALVLAPDTITGYIALSVMSREAAYACARAVSAEQPSWLRPQ